MTEPEIRKFLSSQGLIDEQTHFQMLQGGYLNSVWRIDTAEKSLVAKEFKPPMTGTLFPNLPQDEVNALQRLEGLNVAPDFVGFWPEVSLVVYGYVEGVLSEQTSLPPRSLEISYEAMPNQLSFRYFKTSPEIIQLAVMLYVRFPLSLRNVEDHAS
jgi:hypothetical protein